MATPRREQDLHQSREETDLSSPNFDPLTALYSSDVSIPYPNVQLFNNLAEYESVMKTRTGRQASSANAPVSLSSASATTRLASLTGHSSGEAGYDYGHGPSSTSRESLHQFRGSSETSSFEQQRSSGSHGHLSTTGDDRQKTHKEHYTTDSYQHHKLIHKASSHSTSDQESYREHPDRNTRMEYSDSEGDQYRQHSGSSRDNHSLFSASLRDPEYLAKKGLSEEDLEHYKILRRDSKPSSQGSQVQTKSESGRRATDIKFTKVFGAVGGARGAWSYDTVEKPVEITVSAADSALPKSFEVEPMQTQTSNYRDENRNVFTRMEEYADAKSGPVHLLYRCMKEKLQARVWTRSAVSVRGICKGYIVAFDKHANLAMVDVDEYYRNPAMKGVRLKSKKKLAEKLPSSFAEPPLPCEAVWLGLRREKLSQRHMNQVFIRGDNVVSVSIVQDWT